MIEVKKTFTQRVKEHKKHFYEEGKKRAVELEEMKEDIRKELKEKNSVLELK